jgi:hypothetical protein
MAIIYRLQQEPNTDCRALVGTMEFDFPKSYC